MNRTISPPKKIKNIMNENHLWRRIIHLITQIRIAWVIIRIMIITGWGHSMNIMLLMIARNRRILISRQDLV